MPPPIPFHPQIRYNRVAECKWGVCLCATECCFVGCAPGGDANRSEKSVVMMHYLKKVQKCQLFYQWARIVQRNVRNTISSALPILQPTSRNNSSVCSRTSKDTTPHTPNNSETTMKRTPRKPSVSGFSVDRESLAEWAKDKPLSILQLDPADRAVLRIAGMWGFFLDFIWGGTSERVPTEIESIRLSLENIVTNNSHFQLQNQNLRSLVATFHFQQDSPQIVTLLSSMSQNPKKFVWASIPCLRKKGVTCGG